MPKNVLIVDDDQAILEVTRIVLENEGYTVATVSDYESLETEIASHNPHVILLDVSMPGYSGREIAKKLKGDKKTEKIPVVIVSAKTDIDEITKEVGADDCLEKPFEIEDLVKVVEKYTS